MSDVQTRRRSAGWTILGAMLAALFLCAPPAAAHLSLQCVPYARAVSGIALRGNADGWWDQAGTRYLRGEEPRVGAVLAFRATPAMPHGHVAVVRRILDERHVMLDHANWSGRGMIEHQALAQDVSDAGDWSMVRVWFGPSKGLGQRSNPVYGFIYGEPAADEASHPLGHPFGGGVIAAAP